MTNLAGRHIVSTAWLADNLGRPDIVVLDGSWYLPAERRDARAEYRDRHLPGAQLFDIDALSDQRSSLPHMLPDPAWVAPRLGAMGIGNGAGVVVYDGSTLGLMSAARVWWMLRALGHESVAVLDGGLRKWQAEGRPLTAEPTVGPPARTFVPRPNPALVRDLAAMRALVAGRGAQIADARSPGRFAGSEPEPRPGLRGGHMPGARNVPFPRLLNADGTLKSAPEIAAVFGAAGIDTGKPVVTSCGSGVTAAVLSLALAVAGQESVGLYDGSWSEWGLPALATPVVAGG